MIKLTNITFILNVLSVTIFTLLEGWGAILYCFLLKLASLLRSFIAHTGTQSRLGAFI